MSSLVSTFAIQSRGFAPLSPCFPSVPPDTFTAPPAGGREITASVTSGIQLDRITRKRDRDFEYLNSNKKQRDPETPPAVHPVIAPPFTFSAHTSSFTEIVMDETEETPTSSFTEIVMDETEETPTSSFTEIVMAEPSEVSAADDASILRIAACIVTTTQQMSEWLSSHKSL